MIENNTESQNNYEKQVLYYLLIFRKAMEQYRTWAEAAVGSAQLRHDPQFYAGMEQLSQVIKTCGIRFQEIPEAPEGILEADQLLRKMGKELEHFSESLQSLIQINDPTKRTKLSKELDEQTLAIKQGYRQFIDSYERVYPGRLTQSLRSFQKGSSSR